jgi:glyoxylase I family protein
MPDAINIRNIDHVVLRVTDLEGMIRFYCEALGCTIDKRQDQFGLVHLRAGSAQIDLVDVAGPIGRGGGPAPGDNGLNMDHFCVRVDPFDAGAITAQLNEYGIEAGPAESRFGAEGQGPSIYLTDPEGNKVELKGPPEA